MALLESPRTFFTTWLFRHSFNLVLQKVIGNWGNLGRICVYEVVYEVLSRNLFEHAWQTQLKLNLFDVTASII